MPSQENNIIQQTSLLQGSRAFVMNLICSLHLQFLSLIKQRCCYKAWHIHHHHSIGSQAILQEPFPMQELKISTFLRDTGRVCGHLACRISFLCTVKSQGNSGDRTGIRAYHSPIPKAPRGGQLATLLDSQVSLKTLTPHTSPLYQVYLHSVRDPSAPTCATSQTEGQFYKISGDGAGVPGQPQGNDSPLCPIINQQSI